MSKKSRHTVEKYLVRQMRGDSIGTFGGVRPRGLERQLIPSLELIARRQKLTFENKGQSLARDV